MVSKRIARLRALYSIELQTIALILTLFAPSNLMGQQSAAKRVFLVENDRGGSLHTRVAGVENLRQSGQPVRVVGRVCYSTCTLYLGLPDTCISPTTNLGFTAQVLTVNRSTRLCLSMPHSFIAAYYPAPIRDW